MRSDVVVPHGTREVPVVPVQYLASPEGYGFRYIVHTPLPSAEIRVGSPLHFSTAYESGWYARRFLITEKDSNVVRIATAVVHGTSRVAFSRTALLDDVMLLNGVALGRFAEDSIYASVACGTILVSKTEVPSSGVWKLSVGPLMTLPDCIPSVRLAGIAYSTAPFKLDAVLSYAHLLSVADGERRTDPDAFKQLAWKGAPTASFALIDDQAAPVLVGDASNPKSAAAPAVQKSIGFFRPSDDSAVRISAATHSAVACTVGDRSSFEGTFVAANAVLQRGVAYDCYLHDTADTMHLACLEDASCVGFTTMEMVRPDDGGRSVELPLCLYAAGTAASDAIPYRRMFYGKPGASAEGSKCSVGVAESGRVAVYVQQTVLSSATVTVRINREVSAVCGAAKPFAHNRVGLSGRCGQWVLCFAGPIPSSSTVAVSQHGSSSQGGCANAMGVLIEQVSVDVAQVPIVVAPPAPLLDLTGYVSRAAVKATTEFPDAVSMFVFEALRVVLEVSQTIFENTTSTSPTQQQGSEPPSVEMRSTHSCQSCGAMSGFFGGVAGRSARPDLAHFCGEPMTLRPAVSPVGSTCDMRGAQSAALPFTGRVNISLSAGELFDPDTPEADSRGLLASLYALPYSASSAVPVFPLIKLNGQPSTLFALSAPSLGSSEVPAGAVFLTTVGPLDDRLDAYYVPSWYDGSAASIQSTLPPVSRQVCIVDHGKEQAAQCVFYIPKGATHAVIKAEQTDFAKKAMQVRILTDGKTVRTRTSCGGRSRNWFGSEIGRQQRCNMFRECVHRFMYDDDSQSLSNEAGVILVDLPAGLRSFECPFVATVIAEFSQPNVAPVTCAEPTPFECDGERRCIPSAYVCDAIQDCRGNSDESMCVGSAVLEGEGMCVGADQSRVLGDVMPLSECTRAAVSAQTPVYSYDASAGGQCRLVDAAAARAVMADPEEYVCTLMNTTRTYMAVASRSAFGLCRSEVQCHGRGAASIDPAGQCVCECAEGYIGDGCDVPVKLEEVTHVACVLQRSAGLNLALVSEALRLNIAYMLVDCVGVDLLDGSSSAEVRTLCTARSKRQVPTDVQSHYRRLLNRASWGIVNSTLETFAGHPLLSSITGRTSMIVEDTSSLCWRHDATGTAQADGVATCTVKAAHERLRVEIRDRLPARSIVTTANDRSQQRVIECVPASIDDTGGCVVSACDFAQQGPAAVNVTIASIAFEDPTALTTECFYSSIAISSQASLGNLRIAANSTVANENTDFTPFMITGVSLFLGGTLVSWLIAVVLAVLLWRDRARVFYEEVAPDAELPPYHLAKVWMLVRERLYHDARLYGYFRKDRWATAFATIGVLFAVCASFFVIYYSTAYELRSNFSVLYEEYADAFCDGSTTGYMPRRVFSIPPGATLCERARSTGEPVGVSFAAGKCSGGDGSYNVTIRIGASASMCRDAEEVVVTSGTCLPLRSIDRSTRRDVFVRLSCSSTEGVAGRVAEMRRITTRPDVFVLSEVQPVSDRLERHTVQPEEGPSYFAWPFRTGRVVQTSTSFSPAIVSSQAAVASAFNGDFDTLRIVLQDRHCAFDSGATRLCTRDLEMGLAESMGALTTTAIRDLAPWVADAPLGFLFGSFGTELPETWAGAGYSAHKYYAVHGTPFDMGLHFPNVQEQRSEGDGYTVSLWLRADEATLGFAYAVTDAFEDLYGLAVYPVERLARIIDGGGSSNEWFEGEGASYNVYHSLYVNGAGRTLTFAYASRSISPGIVQHEFDLDSIGAGRVVNGQWHHIALSFVVESSTVRLQLIVDGQTSYTKVGWSSCADALPPAVPSVAGAAIVFDPINDAVYDGGVLVVGYFNGGVYGLQAHTKAMLDTDFMSSGTEAMREESLFPRMGTLGLGIALATVCAFLFAYLIITSGRDLYDLNFSSTTAEYTEVAKAYYSLMLKMIEDESATAQPPRPVRLETALRWCGLSVGEMGTVMKEMEGQDAHPALALLLVCYRVRTGEMETAEFTEEEWAAVQDADSPADVAEDAKREVARLGGLDFMVPLAESYDAAAVTAQPSVSALRSIREQQRRSMRSIVKIIRSKSLVASVAGGEGGVRTAAQQHNSKDDDDDDGARDEQSGGQQSVSVGFGGVGVAKGVVSSDAAKEAVSKPPPTKLSTGVDMAPIAKLSDIVSTLLNTCQSLFVWCTSLGLPVAFTAVFSELFSFVSLDFVTTFPGLPTLVTPIVQILIAGAVVCALVCLLLEDNRVFGSFLTSYVWRRDQLEMRPSQAAIVSNNVTEGLIETQDSELLPRGDVTDQRVIVSKTAHLLDVFRGVQKPVKAEDAVYAKAERLTAEATGNGDTVEFVRDPSSDSGVSVRPVGASAASDTFERRRASNADSLGFEETNGKEGSPANDPLVVVGVRCRFHPDTLLSPRVQSTLWPFHNAPKCCVEGCERSVGEIYSCGRHEVDAEDGTPCVCVYALCEAHFRPSTFELVVSMLHGKLRDLKEYGAGWVLAFAAVLAATSIYTPFIKTALMIVSCHPYYQCEFPECWSNISQRFALAAFLSIVALVLLGLGLPLTLFFILRGRARAIFKVSLDAVHGGKYTDRGENSLKVSEWKRFVSCDVTALAGQYSSLSFRWLYFPSLKLVFKVAILAPSILIEPRTLDQRIGTSVIQLAITLFVFWTMPYLSPVMALTSRVAELHMLVMLALLNFDLVVRYDTGDAETVPAIMIAFTIAYLLFALGSMLLVFVWPVVAELRRKSRLKKFLSSHGYSLTDLTTLYGAPVGLAYAKVRRSTGSWWGGASMRRRSTAGALALLRAAGGAGDAATNRNRPAASPTSQIDESDSAAAEGLASVSMLNPLSTAGQSMSQHLFGGKERSPSEECLSVN